MEKTDTASSTAIEMGSILPLLIAEGVLLLLVLIALPIYAIWKAKNSDNVALKGLALPQGSVRSMLALTVVGSFVIFLVFGGAAIPTGTRFTEVVAALTGIAGTVVGFYFGSGGSGTTGK
ncbi:MAG: hypothetical protein OXM58_05935 [Rhodospirillaceae bacterium]|nr:hypothetical protein [Rhodospirillaceae bacterium]MDE0619138.1 hypothetical protein [Rhodospirillaceae bacterium]